MPKCSTSKQQAEFQQTLKPKLTVIVAALCCLYCSCHLSAYLGAASEHKTSATNSSSGSLTVVNNLVRPSDASDANGQVVYVNFEHLFGKSVADDATTTSPGQTTITTTTTTNDTQQQQQKADQNSPPSTIECGEFNKDGISSLSLLQQNGTIENRIVGGKKAQPGEFPFQVRLNIKMRRGNSLCGGVIIDKWHILTAAHCMTTCYFTGDYQITAQDGEQTIKIASVKAHERYSACSYSHNNYDIAILKTARPMSWVFTADGRGSVNRICLPRPNTNYKTGEIVTVSGWGITYEGEGQISNTLNQVDLPIVSNEECRQTYGQKVNKDHVCAGVKTGGKDSCQGDSGGPLIRNIKGQDELVGIVSFGFGCAREQVPGVYTKVSHYIDWIINNL